MDNTELTECNLRYQLYAKAHGMQWREMLEHDKVRWPGGCMTGFCLWIQRKHIDFWDYMEVPERDTSPLQSPRYYLAHMMTQNYHQRFDEWLIREVT